MPFPANNTSFSKADFVYQQIQQEILSGELVPGDRLVLDRLARKYGVSAVPVREAIRRLEAQNLVDFTRNVGAVVTAVSQEDLLASFETLAVIEAYVTGISVQRLSDSEISEAEQLNEQMREVVKRNFSSQKFSELNARFHRLLASRCTNPRLAMHLQQEWDHHAIQRFSNHGYNLEWCVRSVAEHDEILKLIREREASHKIEAYCRAHNLRVIKQVNLQNSLES
ncbi:transcriptional regulator, GntR family [Gleimia coleocanis DSM 15436]|uniref:Transcriptional regulator, GntR family n=1 Tax=Gleimia coleocanis DSM 15436 TaxID=525245 RepID=C0W072_9ACTO|nr:GntR family transcriptional regulator [Gleimia coleocanis]EEH63931.1 transcriptional regulator, GntR family [Gleimia coleocanis DSM 15436]